MEKDDSDQDLLWANLVERGYEVEDDFGYEGDSTSMTLRNGSDYVTLMASEENQLEEVVLNFNSDEYNFSDIDEELDLAREYFQDNNYLEFYGEKEDFRVGIDPEETEDIVEATMETMDHLSVEGVNTLLSNGKRDPEEET
jgi:hypothetical protein